MQSQSELSEKLTTVEALKAQVAGMESIGRELRLAQTSSAQESQTELSRLQQKLSAQDGKVVDLTEELATLQRHYDEQCQSNDDLKTLNGELKNSLEEMKRHTETKWVENIFFSLEFYHYFYLKEFRGVFVDRKSWKVAAADLQNGRREGWTPREDWSWRRCKHRAQSTKATKCKLPNVFTAG